MLTGHARTRALKMASMIERCDDIEVRNAGAPFNLKDDDLAIIVAALRDACEELVPAPAGEPSPARGFGGLPQAGDDHLMTDPHFAEVPAAEPAFMKLGKALDKVQAMRDAAVSVDPYKRHFGVDVDMAAHGMPQPTETMMKSPAFLAIWDLIMPWFIGTADNVTPFRSTGCHVRAILDALTAAGIKTMHESEEIGSIAWMRQQQPPADDNPLAELSRMIKGCDPFASDAFAPSQATVDAANAERADAARDNLLVVIGLGVRHLLDRTMNSAELRGQLELAIEAVRK